VVQNTDQKNSFGITLISALGRNFGGAVGDSPTERGGEENLKGQWRATWRGGRGWVGANCRAIIRAGEAGQSLHKIKGGRGKQLRRKWTWG